MLISTGTLGTRWRAFSNKDKFMVFGPPKKTGHSVYAPFFDCKRLFRGIFGRGNAGLNGPVQGPAVADFPPAGGEPFNPPSLRCYGGQAVNR
jgi:hypothetical protein